MLECSDESLEHMATTHHPLMTRPRVTLLATGAVLLLALFGVSSPALADVTGGCQGSVDFLLDDAGEYTPANDTRSNAILIPKTEDDVAHWDGSSPLDNRNHSGHVQVQVGPLWITVADWAHPNDANESAKSGDYQMEGFWDEIPGGRNVANGIYHARAVHVGGDGAECAANVFIEFDGNPITSPVVLGAILAVAVLTALYIIAARRAAKVALLVLAIILAIPLGFLIALLLQQFSVWPLDSLTTFGVPILFVLLVFALRGPSTT